MHTGTKTYHCRDQAKDPLFSWVKEEVLRWPTYHTFIKLLDNYETGTGVAEVVTPEEEQENWAFLNSCMETKVTHSFFIPNFINPRRACAARVTLALF